MTQGVDIEQNSYDYDAVSIICSRTKSFFGL